MKRFVYFYKDKNTNEIVTFCKRCARQYGNDLVEIDKAGDWDMCSNCDVQNTVGI